MIDWTAGAAPPAERRIPLVGNRVACPRIGWVEIDRCRECVYLVRVEIEGRATPQTVVCSEESLTGEPGSVW